MNTISWASETQSNPMEINPRTAFERMFGRAGTQAERHPRMQEESKHSRFGHRGSARPAAQGRCRDRARLGDYLENVREIERRIQRTEAQNEERAGRRRAARCAGHVRRHTPR